jgi:hypothetical protein
MRQVLFVMLVTMFSPTRIAADAPGVDERLALAEACTFATTHDAHVAAAATP